jgi:DNA-binding NarL/FixJ family response regulator
VRKLVIVADSSFVIETIRIALRGSATFDLAGKVDGRRPVRAEIRAAQPDVVLVDEMHAGDDALTRIRECREEAPGATVLLLTMRMDDGFVGEALAAGAAACVSKSVHLPGLGSLIGEIASGNVVSAGRRAVRPPALPAGDELTAREHEILGLVAEGLTNARIAKKLWVTEQTVKFHLSNVYRKLGVSNRTEASRYAHEYGLTRQPSWPATTTPQAAKPLAPVHQLRPLPVAEVA